MRGMLPSVHARDLKMLVGWATLCILAAVAGAAQPVARPSVEQLAWQDLEVAAMLGWNLQTICGPKSAGGVTSQPCQASSRSEGALYVPTQEAVASWNPQKLDTDEWARVSASFGAKYIVMVADHMTGFTWWDTKFHNYSIAHTKYKGGGADLVKELIASCKKYGLKLGFFYSVHYNWFLGVDGFKVGHTPLGGRTYTQQEYVSIAKKQLEEVTAMFGEEGPLEIWFDGGTGPFAADIGATVRSIAPRAVCHSCFSNFTKAGSARWMGNEEGMMPLPSWGAAAGDGSEGDGGHPLASSFMPPSTDAVLREHYWFYQNDTVQYTKSTLTLVHNYLTSVGRASNFILNVAPDGTGAIPASDVQKYVAMGRAIKCLFSKVVAETTGPILMDTSGAMTWSFAPDALPTTKNMSLVIREDQREGQLIGDYVIQCRLSGMSHFEDCKMGSLDGVIPAQLYAGIGHKRILMLAASGPLVGLRLLVKSHYATGTQVPAVRDMKLYDWSGAVENCVQEADGCGSPHTQFI